MTRVVASSRCRSRSHIRLAMRMRQFVNDAADHTRVEVRPYVAITAAKAAAGGMRALMIVVERPRRQRADACLVRGQCLGGPLECENQGSER